MVPLETHRSPWVAAERARFPGLVRLAIAVMDYEIYTGIPTSEWRDHRHCVGRREPPLECLVVACVGSTALAGAELARLTANRLARGRIACRI